MPSKPLILGEVPKHDHIRVLLSDGPMPPIDLSSPGALDSYRYDFSIREVVFRAVKHVWNDGVGNHIYWYGWELCR